MATRGPNETPVKVSVYLTRRQREGLAALSGRTLLPVSHLIRRGVDYLLARPEEVLR